MKLRIRPTLLSDLASSYRGVQATRNSSSASAATSTSTSTSTSRRPSRPRRPDIPDELREQGIAPDTILTSTSAVTKSYRPAPAWTVYSNGEQPYLKPNPYADTYKINDNEIGEEQLEPSETASGSDHHFENIQDPGRSTERVRRNTGFGLRSKEDTVEESSKPSNEATRADAATSRFVRTRPEKRELESDMAEGNKATRTIRFKTTERVDIRDGHLVYHHGDHVSDQVWYNGRETEISYHTLRDACPCPKCIHPSTRQRTHTSPEAYREIETSPFRAGVPDQFILRYDKHEEVEGLRIHWSADHTIFFPLSRLRDIAIPGQAMANRLPNRGQRRSWSRKTLDTCKHLHVQFEDLNNLVSRDETLFNTLYQLHVYGIVVVKGVPIEKTGNQDCTLREVMGLIGEIRNTFYGETWNVRNVANSKNVAYTDVNLGLHADLL
jgi:hypothetical protein